MIKFREMAKTAISASTISNFPNEPRYQQHQNTHQSRETLTPHHQHQNRENLYIISVNQYQQDNKIINKSQRSDVQHYLDHNFQQNKLNHDIKQDRNIYIAKNLISTLPKSQRPRCQNHKKNNKNRESSDTRIKIQPKIEPKPR